MGLFDFLSNKNAGTGAVKKYASRVLDKRGQSPERWDAIQALGRLKTAEAVEALLPRFAFYTDPTITDQEEKDAVFRGIVAAGEVAIAPVHAYLRRSESIAWPLRILERLLPAEKVIDDLLELLQTFDVEYSRDPDKKISVLGALEDRSDPRIVTACIRFFEDTNESVRFAALGAVLAQTNAADAVAALRELLLKEESVRSKNRASEGLAKLGA
jgi:HEAT repeat protein